MSISTKKVLHDLRSEKALKKILTKLGGEYELEDDCSCELLEKIAEVVDNGGSSGGSTEEYKTLTITLNPNDNVKDTIEGNDYYSLSDEQYNKLANLRCSEIKSIYFKSSNEYQDPEVHVFYSDKYYFIPTWSIGEENVIGVTPEDEVYPKLMTIGGTHIDAGTHDAILFTVMLNPSFNERRFGIISCRNLSIVSNVTNFIDFCLNPDVEGTTDVLTLNIEYK